MKRKRVWTVTSNPQDSRPMVYLLQYNRTGVCFFSLLRLVNLPVTWQDSELEGRKKSPYLSLLYLILPFLSSCACYSNQEALV